MARRISNSTLPSNLRTATLKGLAPGTEEERPLKTRDELRQEIDLLRDRISRLNEASLRISASLDIGTVLREVVEHARALTGARYGGMATMDDSGRCEEFVTSGFTRAERRRMTAWPDALRLFEHFRNLPGVLRLRDLRSYVRSHGFSTDLMPSKSFLGTPIRHRGAHVGNFFVCGKADGPEFSSEDGEVLLMCAAQAATAIANARTHRDEQRARADLEALVDTSPVGVVVFDARTGKPVTFNREARRIVASLHEPDRTAEQLLEVLTFRREAKPAVSLQEFPLEQVLKTAEAVRAEEIVIEVPDGRSVTTLASVTPIRSEDGSVESVIVTLQDLAPRVEMERLRAEFLSMVSHELRTPLTSIKGSAATALGASPDPDPAEIHQFFRIIDEQADHMRVLINDLLDAGRVETGTLSVHPKATEVASLVEQARNSFLSGGGRETVHIDLPPDLPRVMADRRRIVQVLNNLFSNASRNSPEPSPIRVAAKRDGDYVETSVSDQGRGVPPEMLPHLFRKHMRVGGSDRGIGGSGLGLAICKGLVEAHGGRIRAESDGVGLGATFTFTIPVAEDAGTGAALGFLRSSSRSPRSEPERTHVLVVDDDPRTLRYVRDALTAAGYSAMVTGDPGEVPRMIRTKKPQLVLLDLMLPGMDGIELMERVPEMADLPVIFISGYRRGETIARALEKGAADYIGKPFSPAELTARVRAALRRRDGPSEPFRLGDLAIHYGERRVTLAGRPVQLTATEYELLRVLSVNAGRVLTYDSLLRQVWKRRHTDDHRLVRSFVKMLRRKLGENAADPAYIFNERRVGYRMPRQSDP